MLAPIAITNMGVQARINDTSMQVAILLAIKLFVTHASAYCAMIQEPANSDVEVRTELVRIVS